MHVKNDAKDFGSGLLQIFVAHLKVQIQTLDGGINLTLPPNYDNFNQSLPGGNLQLTQIGLMDTLPPANQVIIKANIRTNPDTNERGKPLFRSENWELWEEDDKGFAFIAPRSQPLRRLLVDRCFTTGELIIENSPINDPEMYPFENFDIQFFANWLALFGDLIFHTAGVSIDGKGYCFSGPSKIGKSTLARQLSSKPEVTVLGEDQVIIRYLDGRFWIFGTPWHENLDMCSPLGVPLEKIYFLEREGRQQVLPLSKMEGVSRLLQNAFIPYYRHDLLPAILDRVSFLAKCVPFFSLDYALGSDVWQLIQ